MPVALFQCGADGRMLCANGAFLALVGQESADAIRGKGIADFIAERTARSSIQDALRAGGRLDGARAELQRKDGGRMAAIVDLRPVHGADGALEYLDGVVRKA
jgi:PAS domain S-box-containing protein